MQLVRCFWAVCGTQGCAVGIFKLTYHMDATAFAANVQVLKRLLCCSPCWLARSFFNVL